jgi:hypothetical protein
MMFDVLHLMCELDVCILSCKFCVGMMQILLSYSKILLEYTVANAEEGNDNEDEEEEAAEQEEAVEDETAQEGEGSQTEVDCFLFLSVVL